MKGEIKNKDLEAVKKALIKKAVGYNTDEIIEEYVIDDKNQERLVKKKITKKFVPADLSASKLLLDYYAEKSDSYDNLSDSELDKEAVKLFKQYQSLTTLDMAKELKGES